ncbi:MAG: radical SAM protein, partial [Nitrospinota bacterium]
MQVCAPSYIDNYQSGLVEERIYKLLSILNSCTLCPHECRVNRLKGEKGICQAGDKVSVSSAFPHFGEEPPLVGRRGSGTIFFANCNLRCEFCQNHDISHRNNGSEVTLEHLAELMLYLQGIGCLNINFVTPTHYAAQIVQALSIAVEMGLNVPLVWNCSGYDSLEVIKLLDGIVDIYMPDVKFGDLENAKHLTTAHNYFENAKPVLKEMYRQVGDLELDDNGI